MSKNIVKYHNSMNEISFAGFTETDLNILFSLCFKMKEQYSNEVTLTFGEINKLIGNEGNKALIKKYLDSLEMKLVKITQKIEIRENVFERFVLFTNFETDLNEKTFTVKVNDKFEFVLNALVNNYTKFELQEFVSLKGIYSKNMYKLLKQFDSTGIREISLEEFRNLVGIPSTYSMAEITRRILTTSVSEIAPFFEDLHCEKKKEGRTITNLKFTWKKKIKVEMENIDIVGDESEEKIDYKGLLLTVKEIEKIIELNMMIERDWLIKIKTEDQKAYLRWKNYNNFERTDYEIISFWNKLNHEKQNKSNNGAFIVPRWEREAPKENYDELINFDISFLQN